jgi:Na+/glutamate symporter
MWLVVWQRLNMSAVEAVLASATAGLFFGLAMGGYYAYGRRKHGLPSWEELSA